MDDHDARVREVIERYKHLLENQQAAEEFESPLMSQEYDTFRQEALEQRVTFYEGACVSLGYPC